MLHRSISAWEATGSPKRTVAVSPALQPQFMDGRAHKVAQAHQKLRAHIHGFFVGMQVPRLVALACWYAVILMALSWLAFHTAYFATQDPRDSGLGTLARTLAFVPVYACALFATFVYPRKRPQT